MKIAEWLRGQASHRPGQGEDEAAWCARMREAADEIERLTALETRQEGQFNDWGRIG